MPTRISLIIAALCWFAICLPGQQTYLVNATDDADDGTCDAVHCSLREAINAANSDLQPTTIEFSIGTGQTETIILNDALPILEEDSTTIDGMTQTGIPGGVKIDCGNIGAQQQDIIRIHGNHTNIFGLEIYNYTVSEDAMTIGAGSLIGIGGIFILASPTTVRIGAPNRGNILHSVFRTRSTAANYGNGIAVHSGTEIIIQGNRIGTNYAADSPLEVYGEGIRIDENNFGETQIGGTKPDEGNIIGTCFNGIGIYGGDGWMRGNHIGVARDLQFGLPNRNHGISIRDGDYYQVGGTIPEEGNFVFNNMNGVDIRSNTNQYVGYNEIAQNQEAGISTISCPDCLFQNNRIFDNRVGISMSDPIGNTRVIVRFNEFFENEIGTEYSFTNSSRDMPITQNSHYCNDVVGIIYFQLNGAADPFAPISINQLSTSQVTGLAGPGDIIEVFEHDSTGCPGSNCSEGKIYMGTAIADATGLWTYNDVFIPGRSYAMTQTIPKMLTRAAACFSVPGCSTLVSTIADRGPGSLREAINCANSTAGPDTIVFDIPGGNPRIIEVLTNLPPLTDDSTVIDATTQPGNFPMNEGVVLDCQNLSGLGSVGITVEGDHCEIYGLTIRNSEGMGIVAGSNVDPVNYLIVGGPDRHNVLTMNDFFGAQIYAGNNVIIQSNLFGTDQSFTSPGRTSRSGCVIELKDTSRNVLIGGDRTLGEGNTFGFCEESGCLITGQDIGPEILILGNNFGTDPSGTSRMPNGGSGSGRGALTASNANCHVGDGSPFGSNIFAYNRDAGIYASGADHLIKYNSFLCNANGGIDHTSQGQMGNSEVSPPEITNANNTLVTGTSQGSGSIEVYFHDDSQCPGAPCQGAYYLGTAVAAPGSGDWSLTGPFAPALNIGDFVTATFSNDDQTSEFSECVQVCPDLVITATNDGPICPGGIVTLSVDINTTSSNIEYTWTGPNNFMSSDESPSGMLEPGTYEVTVVVDGCEYAPKSTELIFQVGDTTSLDTTICSGDDLVIGTQIFDMNRPSGFATLTNSAGCDSTIEVSLTFGGARVYDLDTTICEDDFIVVNGIVYDRNNRSGSDTITAGSSVGCDSVINVDLDIQIAAVYDLDTTLCPKGSILVNGILYDQFYMQGTDTIYGGSARGCDSVINVRIRYPDPVFDLDTILPNCNGSQQGQIVINDISGIPSPFQYSLNGSPFGDISSFPWVIDALDEGSYDIIFMDGKDCRHLVQLMLASTGTIDFDVQSPVSLTLGDSATLSFDADFDPDSVLWKDASGNTVCGNCDEITVNPGSNTTYTVTLYKDGCSATRSIVVEVDSNINVFVPNIFSPDGDGINDNFNVYSDVPGVIVERLNIFDRWGELIYSGQNLDASSFSQGWDGTYQNEPVNPGVYIYHFKVIIPGGRTENYKGSVTIIR